MSGYDNTQPGRLPDLLPHVSVKRIVDWGADAVKILIYYTPFDDAGVNDIKHAFIERIGAECETLRDSVLPGIRRLRSEGRRRERPGVRQDQARDREAQHGGVLEAAVQRGRAESGSADQCRVRRRLQRVQGAEGVHAATKRCKHFREAAAVATKPFIYLSAGVSNAQFTESLKMATEAGTDYSGVLCGRATWKEGIPVYAKQGVKALEDWLQREGVKNINAVNDAIQSATPWYAEGRARERGWTGYAHSRSTANACVAELAKGGLGDWSLHSADQAHEP